MLQSKSGKHMCRLVQFSGSLIGGRGWSSNKKKRKGQILIIEEMMMFALGALIIIGIIFIFKVVNDGILEFVQDGQTEEINGYIKAHIVSLNSMNCTRCHITVKIPETISGEEYTIYGAENKKKILIHNDDRIWSEKNLSVDVVGLSYGSKMLRLEYNDGVIFMRGVNDY